MEQEIYKVCPYCGSKNAANAIECVNCEADIFGVGIGTMQPVTLPTTQPTTADNMVRICEECGFHNPVNSRKCQSCGEDISDIVPVSDSVGVNERTYTLASLDGKEVFLVTEEAAVIGRSEGMKEYLESKGFVSRKHATVFLRDEKMYVQNLSKTNFTFVNNVRIPDNDEIELQDGDELALGGNEQNGNRQEQAAYFQIRISSCS